MFIIDLMRQASAVLALAQTTPSIAGLSLLVVRWTALRDAGDIGGRVGTASMVLCLSGAAFSFLGFAVSTRWRRKMGE